MGWMRGQWHLKWWAVMGRTLAVMAWMAAVRFEPIRGPEQISRPIDCFPLCPKILFMQPSGSSPNAAALIFPARQQGLCGIITIKKMEGKLEGQQALFCFWIASYQCVCVVRDTPPRSRLCHNTGSSCSQLWCDTVDSGHPSCFLCWCPPRHPCLLRHTTSLLRYMYLYSFLLNTFWETFHCEGTLL